MKPRLLLCVLALAGGAAMAAESGDLDALDLADKAPLAASSTREWRAVVEAGAGVDRMRASASDAGRTRLSASFEWDQALADGWRFVLADRYDLQSQAGANGERQQTGVNTLRELYVSRQFGPRVAMDAGRVNVRQGVALGYNPTDYLRANSLRSVVTVDPASIKSNRQGSVMLRGQYLWPQGAVSVLYSPKLATPPAQGPYSSLEASNPADRWMVTLTQQLWDGFAPQWVVFHGAGEGTQLGMNLTSLLNDATVLYAEWSGGRSATLLARALGAPGDPAWRNRLAAGVTNTSLGKLSVTLEYEYNGAALGREAWNALRTQGAAYGRYRVALQGWQELPTRDALFLFARWQDAGIRRLDLSAMRRLDLVDHSRLSLFEAVYHLDHSDVSLQLQVNSGQPASDFGAIPQRRRVSLVFRQFF